MSRSLLHDWEPSIENLSIEMRKIAEDIYNTAYARGKNHSDVTEALDKIRAEIEECKQYRGMTGNPVIDNNNVGLDKYFDLGLEKAIKIIDKYKESDE